MHQANPHIRDRAAPQFNIQIQDDNGQIIGATPALISKMCQHHKTVACPAVDCDLTLWMRELLTEDGFHHSKYALVGDYISYMEEINQTKCKGCGAKGHCYDVCPTYAKMQLFAGANPFLLQILKEYVTGSGGGSSSVSGTSKEQPVKFSRAFISKDVGLGKRAKRG